MFDLVKMNKEEEREETRVSDEHISLSVREKIFMPQLFEWSLSHVMIIVTTITATLRILGYWVRVKSSWF